MEQLIGQIKKLLPIEKRFLHGVYEKIIRDHAYLWGELDDLDKLRNILLVIIKLFIEEHKNLRELSDIDQEEFTNTFRELLADRNALLQKGRKYQIKEIEEIGIEKWIGESWAHIGKINALIEKYEEDRKVESFNPTDVKKVVDALGKGIERKIRLLVVALWRKRIKTTGSCHGHTLLRGLSYPWVDLALGQELSNLERWVNAFNRQSEIKWEILRMKGFVGDTERAYELARQGNLQMYISEHGVTSRLRLKPIQTFEETGVVAKFMSRRNIQSLRDTRRSAIRLAEFIEKQ